MYIVSNKSFSNSFSKLFYINLIVIFNDWLLAQGVQNKNHPAGSVSTSVYTYGITTVSGWINNGFLLLATHATLHEV